MWYAKLLDNSVTCKFASQKELIEHLDQCAGCGQADIYYENVYMETINL